MSSRGTPLLKSKDMVALDRFTIDAGTPSLELMERAGRAVSEQLLANPALRTKNRAEPRILVLAGRGSNGGDGLVVARMLVEAGWEVDVTLAMGRPGAGTDAAVNLERWERLGRGPTLSPAEARHRLGGEPTAYEVVLDTLFGTGLDRDLNPETRELVETLNAARLRQGLLVVAVDLPSGLSADDGQVMGATVEADATVTIGAGKLGLFLGQGIRAAGKVTVADIGLADPQRAGIKIMGEVLDETGCRRFIGPRQRDAHKGSQGHVLIVGGSAGKTGAALLAARAALRAGAGLVSLAVPSSVAATVDAEFTETMTTRLADRDGEPDRGAMAALAPELDRFDAVVVGPGLGTGEGAHELVEGLAQAFEGPLVLDADALNIVAGARARLVSARKGRPALLTPHPGEMARLLGTDSASVQTDRLEACRRLVADGGLTVVLKGAATVVSDGSRLAFNSSGNPGMASAGMGDVLAGTVGAFAAAGLGPFEAASLAVYLHGRAADLLAARLGGPGFLAGEVADALPEALSALIARPV